MIIDLSVKSDDTLTQSVIQSHIEELKQIILSIVATWGRRLVVVVVWLVYWLLCSTSISSIRRWENVIKRVLTTLTTARRSLLYWLRCIRHKLIKVKVVLLPYWLLLLLLLLLHLWRWHNACEYLALLRLVLSRRINTTATLAVELLLLWLMLTSVLLLLVLLLLILLLVVWIGHHVVLLLNCRLARLKRDERLDRLLALVTELWQIAHIVHFTER